MQLLSGGNHDIDVDDLKINTRYTGGFSEGSRTIKIFWEVLNTELNLCELILSYLGFQACCQDFNNFLCFYWVSPDHCVTGCERI